MIELEIEEKILKKMNDFFKETPKIMDKVIKKSLSVAGTEIRKFEKKEIERKYQIDKNILNPRNIVLKKSFGEVSVFATKKARNIDEFDISSRTPKKSGAKIKASIFKSTAPVEMETMFWGFFKKKKASIGLYKRSGRKIKKVKSPSVHAMASNINTLPLERKLQEIFNKELEKQILKEVLK